MYNSRQMQCVAVMILLSVAVTFPVGRSAIAQDKVIEMKLANWVPPSHEIHIAMERWGASVEKASNGTIKYKVYPSQQLGKAFDYYDMARDGIADLTFVNPGYQPGRFPIIGAGELPFLISNAKGGSVALDAWYRKYAPKEMREVKFCLAFMHDLGTFHSKSKKITTPSDVKGVSVRPANATMATFVAQLGGTNVQSSAPEVRDLLEKGVVEAVTFPWGGIQQFGVDKVTKYHMELPLYTTTFVFVLNKEKYNQMSAMQKKVIDDHCSNEWVLKVAAPWIDFEHDGIAKVKALPNRDVYNISAAQLAEWKKAAAPLITRWADNVKKSGVDPDVSMKELRANLAKHNALME